MNKNGYSDSLFDTNGGEDYIIACLGLDPRVTDTVRHEVFGGSRRKLSKADGLWINLSPQSHADWHDGKIPEVKEALQERAEILWLTADWSRSIHDFVERYGKNYIGVSDRSEFQFKENYL
jgi:hypothetical protein